MKKKGKKLISIALTVAMIAGLTAVLGIVIGLKQKVNRISLSGQQINIHIV